MDEKTKEYVSKIMKKYDPYFIKSYTAAKKFLYAGAVIDELRKEPANTYKFPGKQELPPHKGETFLEQLKNANKISEFLVITDDDDNLIIDIPYSLLYILDKNLYEKYRNAEPVKIKGTNKKESEKLFKNKEDFIITDVMYVETIYYLPIILDNLHNPEYDRMLVVYFQTDEEMRNATKEDIENTVKLPENLDEMSVEERMKIAKNINATLVLIHKETATPFPIPFGVFIILLPQVAKEIVKNTPKLTAEEYIEYLNKILR